MAAIEAIPRVYELIRKMVVEDHRTHKDVSIELQRHYPSIKRGLSERSVRRFCDSNDIHPTSRFSDVVLDITIRRCVARVGSSYGRRMMTGLLGSHGIRVSQLRVGQSLQRVNPGHHQQRVRRINRLTNPISYRSEYAGEKLHIDQNEKLVMFGITHVCAIDGHSGKIVSFITMPIKNNIVIYERVFMKLVQDYGTWNQLRVDKGREWYLMLFIQAKLSHHRNDTSKPSFLQTSSKQNHMIERLWVEVNIRVNYPMKKVLIEMDNCGDINMADSLTKYCVSWFCIEVLNVGIKMFINSWNHHPVPGRRRGGMRSHIPIDVFRSNDRVTRLDLRYLPSTLQAVSMYECETGGRISQETEFGNDPLRGDVSKCSIRSQAFFERHPSFDDIFHNLVNLNSIPFRNALLFYIDITYRLSSS